MLEPQRQLVALVGRGVGHEQDLAAGFGDAFDRARRPHVLTDRHADAHAGEGERPGIGPGAEDALLVEDAVIGQIDLEAHGGDAPAVEQRGGVVERAILDPRQADQHAWAAIGGLARKALAGGAAGLLEGRLEHQILGRIAGEIEFGRHDEIGAEGRRLRPRRAQALQIALDVADDRGNLRERDDQAVGGGRHARHLARGRRRAQSASQAARQRDRTQTSSHSLRTADAPASSAGAPS